MEYERKVLFINKKFEIALIDWDENAGSCIHHHDESACIVGVVEGKFEDRLYSGEEDKEFSSSFYETHNILETPMNTCHSLHSRSAGGRTIHVYSPPLEVDKDEKIDITLEEVRSDLSKTENTILDGILSKLEA